MFELIFTAGGTIYVFGGWQGASRCVAVEG